MAEDVAMVGDKTPAVDWRKDSGAVPGGLWILIPWVLRSIRAPSRRDARLIPSSPSSISHVGDTHQSYTPAVELKEAAADSEVSSEHGCDQRNVLISYKL